MAQEQLSHGARANFDAQRRSRTFRKKIARQEVESFRDWFLAPGETGGALVTLANYASVTYTPMRNRGEREDPKQLTIELVQDVIKSWLDENPPDDFSGPDLTQWVRRRLEILSHARNWGNSQRHYRDGERKGQTRRMIASFVCIEAQQAIERLRGFLDDDDRRDDRKPGGEQGTLFPM